MPNYHSYETYKKNRDRLERVIGEVIDTMKGHTIRIQDRICDRGKPDQEMTAEFIREMLAAYGTLRPFDLNDGTRRLYGSYLYISMRRNEWLARLTAYLDPHRRIKPVTFQNLITDARELERALSEGESLFTCPGFEIYGILPGPEKPDESKKNNAGIRLDIAADGPKGDAESQAPYGGEDLDGVLRDLRLKLKNDVRDAEQEYADAVQAAMNRHTANHFEFQGAYMSACEEFAKLANDAGNMAQFADTVETIIDAYLSTSGIAPVCDTDKALDVYARIYDGPCKAAAQYASGKDRPD